MEEQGKDQKEVEKSKEAEVVKKFSRFELLGDRVQNIGKGDLEVLRGLERWLQDTHINLFCEFLREQYENVGSLQDVTVVACGQALPVTNGARFVQIIHHEGHWITVSNMMHYDKETISIYDSKCDSIGRSIQAAAIDSVWKILPKAKKLKFYYEQVTQQSDNHQCGLMSLAYAKALCSGRDPADIEFCDDPKILRDHLLKCLALGRARSFPTGSVKHLVRFRVTYT